MEDKTTIKTSLTDLTNQEDKSGSDLNDSTNLGQSKIPKKTPPPDNLPQEGSEPVPVPIVDSSTNEDEAEEKTLSEIPKDNPKKEKDENSQVSEDEKQTETKENNSDDKATGPLDFNILKPELSKDNAPEEKTDSNNAPPVPKPVSNQEDKSSDGINNLDENKQSSPSTPEIKSEELEKEFSELNQKQTDTTQETVPEKTTQEKEKENEETSKEKNTQEESHTIKISNSSTNSSEQLKSPQQSSTGKNQINPPKPISNLNLASSAQENDSSKKNTRDIRSIANNNLATSPNSGNNKPKLNKVILIGSLVFITLLIGVGLFYYLSFSKQKKIAEEEAEAFKMEIKPVSQEEATDQIQTETSGIQNKEEENQLKIATESKEIELLTLEELSSKIAELKTSEIIGGNLIQLIPTLEKKEINLTQLKEALGIVIPIEIAKEDTLFALLAMEEGEIIKMSLVLATTDSPEIIKSQMLEWENTLVGDLNPLLLGETTEDPDNPEGFHFYDSSKFPNGRFISLSKSKNLSIDYSILADKILIATSYSTLEELTKIATEEN
jgi:hypothetical protein